MSVIPEEIEFDDSIPYDSTEIARALEVFCLTGGVHELRALGAPRQGVVSGYYDGEHRDEFVQEAVDLSGIADGVYFTLNPVKPDVVARSKNRAKAYAKYTSTDADVLIRRFLPLDFDPTRPAGISSTDAEHDASIKRAYSCRAYLLTLGVKEDSLVLCDSGNGAHLVCRIDVPNDPAGRDLIKKCIDAVAARFTDDAVKVDQTTFNAARIWKLPGTLACKGDSTADRPHRLARMLEVPDELIPVPVKLLEKLASLAPVASESQPFRSSGSYTSFNIDDWLLRHQVPVEPAKPWNGGRLWVMKACPWNAAHTNAAAFVIEHASGAISARCHHDGCHGKGWRDLRDVYEAGWRSRAAPAAGDRNVAKPPITVKRTITLPGRPAASLKKEKTE